MTKRDGGPAELVLVRDVLRSECPWLDRDLRAGERLFRYPGYTYGCVSPAGIAMTEEAGQTPFFEVPREALAQGE